MKLNLEGKTALVTGASAGLGRSIAAALAAGGGFRPQIAPVDLMQEDAAPTLVGRALEKLGQIDIVVHCAGGSSRMSLTSPEVQWQATATMKYTRVRQLTLAALSGMIERRWGRIINISGKSEPVELLSATPANGAWHAFAKALSREVGRSGVTVNSIAPGLIMSEQIGRRHSAEHIAQRAAQEIPLGRYGEPEELACVAAFLASPVASYITGAIIPVDGGLRRFAF